MGRPRHTIYICTGRQQNIKKVQKLHMQIGVIGMVFFWAQGTIPMEWINE